MKKLLSLLSVLTISGTAAPTLIAASPYQKQEIKLENSEINYSQTNNLEKLNRNKRDFYEKEQIEFFNNNFFYKFNIKYDNEKRTNGAFDNSASVLVSDSITLINDWTKFANSWEEFSTKFPKLELINFKSVIDDDKNVTKDNFTIENMKDANLVRKEEINKINIFNDKLIEINNYRYRSFVCAKDAKIFFKPYVDKKELKAQIIYSLAIHSCTSSYKASVKFDSIRLVGKIDINPLFWLTIEKTKQFDSWAKNKEKELKSKREDPNYNKSILFNEENSFKENFKLWLLQIRHDYIQDLINISQNNEIISLKTEIDNIKSRLDKLENPNTCLDNIFNAFKNNTLSDATGDSLKSTWENSDSPLKVILKLSGKAFAKGLLTGVGKGAAISILSCVADSIL